ncbi:MAG: GumC family protein, partial [Desulfosudaceae bacterium]
MENNPEIQEQEVHLKDYLRVLKRRKYVILLVLAVSIPLIIIRAFSGEPMYGATAKLLIEPDTTPTLLTEHRLGRNPGFLTTQTQVIKSKKVARQVVEKLNLDETYRQYLPEMEPEMSIFDKVINWFQDLFAVGLRLAGIGDDDRLADSEKMTEAEKEEQRINTLVVMISEGITVESDRDGGNVVNVSFVSSNPQLAADIANTVAAAYKGFLLEMRTESTAETLEWLKEKAALQQEKLQASEQKLQYKKEQDIYTVGDEEAMFPAKIAELSNRLTRAQAEVGELESLYKEIRGISLSEAINLPAVAESETVRSLRKKILDQENEIERLSKSIGEKHPRMVRARDNLESLRFALRNEVDGVIQSLKNKYELAREKAEIIDILLEETKQSASLMNDKLIQYEILKRDVDVNSLLYDRMLRRIKEFDVTDTSQPIDVWVVEDASVPEFPQNKRPKRTLMLGGLLSLMLGVGLAFFLEYLDNTVKTVEDAEPRLGLPVLGTVPLLKDSEYPVEQIVRKSPRSVIAESYKSLRTAVLLSSPNGAPRSLLISSM